MHDQNWQDEPDTMLDDPDPIRDPDNDLIDILTIADSVETENVVEENSESSEENDLNENERPSEKAPPDEPTENDESKQ